MYGSGKGIWGNIIKNANDDTYVQHSMTTATYSESFPVIGRRNYVARTGTWQDTSAPNIFANRLSGAATVTIDFVGTGFDLRHYADHRGGIWSFVIDGTSDPILIDTYVPSGGPVITTRVVSDLPFGQHRAVGTLLNTVNPGNTSGEIRGWISLSASPGDNDSTISELGTKSITFLSTPITIKQPSNIEFAIAARKQGATHDTQWIPDHGTGTLFLRVGQNYSVTVDGRAVSQGGTAWKPVFDKVEFSGKYVAKLPADNEELCNIDLTHHIMREGIESEVDITWLQNCECDGYSGMFRCDFASQVETDSGDIQSIPPVDNEILTGSPWVGSLLATKPAGTTEERKVWIAVDWSIDQQEIVRPNDSNNRRQLLGVTALQWIAVTGKMYNHVWGGGPTNGGLVIVPAGTKQGWKIRMAAGLFSV